MKKLKSWYNYILGDIITKPTESPNASSYLVKMVWFLRISIYFFGIYQLFRGEVAIGVMIVICVLFLVAPSFFTRNRITDIPLELEFFLFIIVFFQFVVGEAQGFYGKISYYDDIIHFFFPFLISVMAFTIAYALYFAGKIKASIKIMIFFVIVLTLGIGAFWEIIEYTLDLLFMDRIEGWNRVQGRDAASAFHDTMTDLVHDFFGGIVGAIVASKYIVEAKSNKRIKELFREIVTNFFRGRKVSKR